MHLKGTCFYNFIINALLVIQRASNPENDNGKALQNQIIHDGSLKLDYVLIRFDKFLRVLIILRAHMRAFLPVRLQTRVCMNAHLYICAFAVLNNK